MHPALQRHRALRPGPSGILALGLALLYGFRSVLGLEAIASSSSADYSIPHAALDGSGGRSQSADYSVDTSMHGLGDSVASPAYRLRNGFAGQLNEAPIARPSEIAAPSGTPVRITLTATDAEGDPPVFRVVSPPTRGTLSGDAPNFTYTPGPGFAGSDRFVFVAGDRLSESAPVAVTVVSGTVPDVRVDLIVDLDRTLALTLTGPPSSCFQIETSTDLETWTSFALRRTDAAGRFVLVDQIPPTLNVRWFRAQSIPCDASIPP